MSWVVLVCLSAILRAPSDDLERQAQHLRDLSEPPRSAIATEGAPASFDDWQLGDPLPLPPPRYIVDDYIADLAKLPPDPATLQLLVENDFFFTVDRHYSSGVNGLYTTSAGGTPKWMKTIGRLFSSDAEVHATFGAGHNIYTPRSISLATLSAYDRPYAGFLYAIAGIQSITARNFDDLTLTAGVTGPIALGRQFQELIHTVITGPHPARWDTQLTNEPVFVLSYQHTWRRRLGRVANMDVEIYPHLGAAVGTVYTYAAQGLQLRFGDRMPLDYGPSRVLPGIQGSGVFSQPNRLGWYFFAGGELREVARNIWLDGNTFVDSRSVPKIPIVGDLQFGWALVWPNFRVSMTYLWRTREFEKQAKPDVFGSLDLAWHL